MMKGVCGTGNEVLSIDPSAHSTTLRAGFGRDDPAIYDLLFTIDYCVVEAPAADLE